MSLLTKIEEVFDLLKLDVLKFLNTIGVPVVNLVNVLKTLVNGPVGAEVASLGTIPAEVVAALRSALPAIAQYLTYIKPVQLCLASGTDAEVLQCLAAQLKNIDPNLLPEVYGKIAALISAELAKVGIPGTAVTASQLNLLVELAYQKVTAKA